MIIYKHTNILTGESYIGMTKYSIETRLKGHIKAANAGSAYHFHRAIRKYGIECFVSEILEEVQSKEEMIQREKYWITYYDAFDNGYNMTIGGECGGAWTKESHDKGVKTRKENGSYKIGGEKRKQWVLENSSYEEINLKSAETKRASGFFEEYGQKIREQGGIGYFHTCVHCGKDVKGANYKRWHGDNCKHNPNITEEQQKMREPWNKVKH